MQGETQGIEYSLTSLGWAPVLYAWIQLLCVFWIDNRITCLDKSKPVIYLGRNHYLYNVMFTLIYKYFLNLMFFKKMGQPRPLLLFIFGLFKQISLQFLQQIYVKKCPSSLQCQDLNPRPSEHEFLPITTRPGLPPSYSNVRSGHCRHVTQTSCRLTVITSVKGIFPLEQLQQDEEDSSLLSTKSNQQFSSSKGSIHRLLWNGCDLKGFKNKAKQTS